MRMSCINAISTGTAYFHSNLSAMYAEITISEEMIAMIAELATVWPNVGPIDVELGVSAKSNFWSSACWTRVTWFGRRVAVEIWNLLAPLPGRVTFWISA